MVGPKPHNALATMFPEQPARIVLAELGLAAPLRMQPCPVQTDRLTSLDVGNRRDQGGRGVHRLAVIP